MMAFSSGLRVPTISAQREREKKRETGESERRRREVASRPKAHAGRIVRALDWKPVELRSGGYCAANVCRRALF